MKHALSVFLFFFFGRRMLLNIPVTSMPSVIQIGSDLSSSLALLLISLAEYLLFPIHVISMNVVVEVWDFFSISLAISIPRIFLRLTIRLLLLQYKFVMCRGETKFVVLYFQRTVLDGDKILTALV